MIEKELSAAVPDVRTSSTPSMMPEATLSKVSKYIELPAEATKDPTPVKGPLSTVIFAGEAKELATKSVTLPKSSKS